jgi:hypothetical protein
VSAPQVGSRVEWAESTRKGEVVHHGTVASLDGPHGRIIVTGDDGNEHHMQPNFCEVVG